MANDTDIQRTALIRRISAAGDKYGDRLVDFMDRNHLSCLMDATVEQLQDYIIISHAETCVSCGAVIPEDYQCCPNCMGGHYGD